MVYIAGETSFFFQALLEMKKKNSAEQQEMKKERS